MTTQHGEPWGQPMDDSAADLYLGDWQVQSLRYMRSKEGQYCFVTSCISQEEYVQSINFIHGICHRLKTQLETLLHACNIFNHVMSKVVRRDVVHKMDVVCGACVTLAYKYEEATFWEEAASVILESFAKNITKADFMSVEIACWTVIQFDLGYPNPLHFLRWTSMYAEDSNAYLRRVAKFLLECFTLSDHFRTIPASMIACACTFGARQILQITPLWSPAHIEVTGLTVESLLPISMKLKEVLDMDAIHRCDIISKHSPLSTQVIARRHLLERL